MTALTHQRTARIVLLGVLVLVLVALGARSASAQETTTLTVSVGVVPATGPARFDLAIDGVVLTAGVGDGGTTGALSVLPGSFVVAQLAAPGSGSTAWSTVVTCVDGSDVLVAAAPLTATAVEVERGHAVSCTFVNTALPSTTPVVAPPITAKPILLPPVFVRGTAIMRGTAGCTSRSVVTTRVIARNLARLVFVRDGRVVKRVAGPSLAWRSYALETALADDDATMHTVQVRAFFISGATPRLKLMAQRFGHCRGSAVAG